MILIKRIYDEPATSDGYRVLIDRLWPRGMSKERAALDAWLKNVAPSSELRKWFGHQPERFAEFKEKYQAELAHNDAVPELMQLAQAHKQLTLLYGAKDPIHNHAIVLKVYLEDKLATP